MCGFIIGSLRSAHARSIDEDHERNFFSSSMFEIEPLKVALQAMSVSPFPTALTPAAETGRPSHTQQCQHVYPLVSLSLARAFPCGNLQSPAARFSFPRSDGGEDTLSTNHVSIALKTLSCISMCCTCLHVFSFSYPHSHSHGLD